jgi:hypothetical protein
MNSTKLMGTENSGTQKLGFGACARRGSYSRAHLLGQLVHQPHVYLKSKYLFKDPLPPTLGMCVCVCVCVFF